MEQPNSAPFMRDESADVLHGFKTELRWALARHRASRLDLLFLLQFPDLSPERPRIPVDFDLMQTLDMAAPGSLKEHKLWKTVRQQVSFAVNRAALAIDMATKGTLDPAGLRALVEALRRLDGAVDRLDVAITASLTDLDPLTGLFNRNAMERDLNIELHHARASGQPLCVAMVDADHFKNVNDSLGHPFGDVVLQALAERFEAVVRPHDRVYRFGGEEFLVLLPETTLEDAVLAIDRLREHVCASPITDGSSEVTQTVSSGVALAGPDEQRDALIARADEALYKAKEAGRNRVLAA